MLNLESSLPPRFASLGAIPLLGASVGVTRLVYAIALGIIGLAATFCLKDLTHLKNARVHLVRAMWEISTILIFPAFWIAKHDQAQLKLQASSPVFQQSFPFYPGRGRFLNPSKENCEYNSFAIICAHTGFSKNEKEIEEKSIEIEKEKADLEEELHLLEKDKEKQLSFLKSYKKTVINNFKQCFYLYFEDIEIEEFLLKKIPSDKNNGAFEQALKKSPEFASKHSSELQKYSSKLQNIEEQIQQLEKENRDNSIPALIPALIQKKIENINLKLNKLTTSLNILHRLRTQNVIFKEEDSQLVKDMIEKNSRLANGMIEELPSYSPYLGNEAHTEDVEHIKLKNALFNSDWRVIKVGGLGRWLKLPHVYTLVRNPDNTVDEINDSYLTKRSLTFNQIFNHWSTKGIWKKYQLTFYYPEGATLPENT